MYGRSYKWFSKLDANQEYWQIPLDEESQPLATFNTLLGRYCYLCTPFGITSAQEALRKRMSQHFGDLEEVETDTDYIIHTYCSTCMKKQKQNMTKD